MCPVASGHWRNEEGWGTFFSGLFSLWSQDLKETKTPVLVSCLGHLLWHLVYCCSVVKSCLTLYDPVDCSMPGFPVLHHLLEFAKTHVHWVSDAIQPSHPLLPPSPPALNLSQHQSLLPMSRLFPSGGQSTGAAASASVLPVNIQGWFPLGLTGLISFNVIMLHLNPLFVFNKMV